MPPHTTGYDILLSNSKFQNKSWWNRWSLGWNIMVAGCKSVQIMTWVSLMVAMTPSLNVYTTGLNSTDSNRQSSTHSNDLYNSSLMYPTNQCQWHLVCFQFLHNFSPFLCQVLLQETHLLQKSQTLQQPYKTGFSCWIWKSSRSLRTDDLVTNVDIIQN